MPQLSSHSVARLDALMARLWGRRLGLVVAPAGSGKTTLVTRFALNAGVPVAWYRCESWDVGADDLLRHLEAAFSTAFGSRTRSWAAIEDAIADLEGKSAQRVLLVIDDAHSIIGTPAEALLERFIDYAPPNVLTVIASRTQPGFNVSRLRVAGGLVEISGDDLRFRSWEVEELFRQYYGEPLPPVELAELARRTEGWAAGLQLFHLATSGKRLDERRRVLRALNGGSRLVREYLTRNVLDELPKELRDFLVETCVLGRLNAAICNEFLERGDSRRLLQELERRQIFTTAVGDGEDYRYHEVLRSHLEHALVAAAGERTLRIKYHHAGTVLERFGAIPEALHAYCRAEDWAAFGRVLGDNGAELARSTGLWIDALPPVVLDHDPWLLLASARRHRAEGRWHSAIEAYQRAEAGFGGLEAAQICQRERQSLAAWLSPTAGPAVDAIGLLRQATVRDPSGVAAQLAGSSAAQDVLVAGLASLLAGNAIDARRLLQLATEVEASDAIVVTARIAGAVASLLAGEAEGADDLQLAIEEADAQGQRFVARLGRAAGALVPGARASATAGAVSLAAEHLGDQWGVALASLIEGWSLVASGDSEPEAARVLDVAAERFRELGAGVLEAWSRSLLALALACNGQPAAMAAALKAESLANSAGVDGPKMFVYLALARSDGWQSVRFHELARSIAARTGLAEPAGELQATATDQPDAARISVSCFGEFQISIDSKRVVMASMKPRTRALLRRLCADAGRPIHREVLQEALWPTADAESASRNLHVAVSSLRQALQPGVARGASSLIIRDGESYRLVLPPGSEVDLAIVEEKLEQSRLATTARDLDRAVEAYRTAAAMAAKELLPEEGSVDWIVQRRERVHAALSEVGHTLARQLIAAGSAGVAADVAATALARDRYDDEMWRLLIQARERAGDGAGARRAQSDYRKLVSELAPSSTGS